MRILERGDPPILGAIIACGHCKTKTLFVQVELKEEHDQRERKSWYEATCPTCRKPLQTTFLRDVTAEMREADAKNTKAFYAK